MDTLGDEFEACLSLFRNGGGCVNLQYEGPFEEIEGLFKSDWVVAHHENLCMMTVELPSIGCLSLLHPNIIIWELDKHDIHPSEENE
ncbi:hypothetical protein OA172_00135 [Euryarchaeota archaeon]|nr:hypothetical protein [Euryarchaeota archaeon]